METTLTCEVPCTILVRSESARARFNALVERFYADGVDPLWLKWLRCHLEWDGESLNDWRNAVCSNCYSERVVLTSARLSFNNWGEYNGGERDQRERFDAAVKATASAMKAIRELRKP